MTVAELAAWLAAIMMKWTPAAVPAVPAEDVAQDIAQAVVLEGSVAELGEKKTAGLLASLAYWEGARFARYVDDGSCNAWQAGRLGLLTQEAKKLLAYGHCDHGRAFSLWQIWPRDAEEKTALAVRSYAARRALERVKSSWATRGNLSAYAGEPRDRHPKADEREAFARRFFW